MSLTEQQWLERQQWLGGTDAAAIAGVNPPGWDQPIDVYLQKHGLAQQRPSSAAMAVGSLLEQVVADLATAATGMRWRRQARPARHPAYPWMGGYLDRVAAGYDPTLRGREGQHFEPGLEQAILEIKTSSSDRGWGPQGSTTIPPHYAVQVQHYLATSRRPVAIVAVLLLRGDFRWYRIPADPTVGAYLIELEERWWRRHGPPNGEPPEPDGSESYGQWLRRRYDADAGEERVATPEQLAMLEELRQARQDHVTASIRRQQAEQRLMESMGTTAVLVAPGARVSWKRGKNVTKVEWEELATRLLRRAWGDGPDADLDEQLHLLEGPWPKTKKDRAALVRTVALALDLASVEPGTRPFRVEFDEDEEQA